MNITLLGTSHGVPSAERFTSCYMVEAGGNIYIFDAGAPVIDLLLRRGKELTKVKALFNTHFHGDHILGGLSMISLFGWYYKDTDMDVYLPEERSRDAVVSLISMMDSVSFGDRIRMNVFEEGVVFDDGVLKVTAYRTGHGCGDNKKAYAFLIEGEGQSILYTGDMSSDPANNDFPKIAYERHIDMIISECAHFSTENLAQCMERVDTDIFVVSHVHPVVTKFPELEAMRDRFSFELLIAEDEDEIEL